MIAIEGVDQSDKSIGLVYVNPVNINAVRVARAEPPLTAIDMSGYNNSTHLTHESPETIVAKIDADSAARFEGPAS
jgi:hypothetical protein